MAAALGDVRGLREAGSMVVEQETKSDGTR